MFHSARKAIRNCIPEVGSSRKPYEDLEHKILLFLKVKAALCELEFPAGSQAKVLGRPKLAASITGAWPC